MKRDSGARQNALGFRGMVAIKSMSGGDRQS
jgi:hypothetical protein